MQKRQILIFINNDAEKMNLETFFGELYTVISCHNLGENYDFVRSSDHFLPKLKVSFNLSDTYPDLVPKLYKQIYLVFPPTFKGELLTLSLYHQLIEQNCPSSRIKRLYLNAVTREGFSQSVERAIKIKPFNAAIISGAVDYYLSETFNKVLKDNLTKNYSWNRLCSHVLYKLCEFEQNNSVKNSKKWQLTGDLKTQQKTKIFAGLSKIKGRKPNIFDVNYIKAVVIDLKQQEFKVAKIKNKKLITHPFPPYTMVSLVSDACRLYKFSPARIICLVHELDGVDISGCKQSLLNTVSGTFDSEDIAVKIRELIFQDYGNDYLPKQKRVYGEKSLQLFIYPANIKLTPKKLRKHLTPEQHCIYTLIWNRTIASQMKDAVKEQIEIELQSEDEKYTFSAFEEKELFRGFCQVYDTLIKKKRKNASIPETVREGQIFKISNIDTHSEQVDKDSYYSCEKLFGELAASPLNSMLDPYSVSVMCHQTDFFEFIDNKVLPTDLARKTYNHLQKNFPRFFNFEKFVEFEELFEKCTTEKRFSNVWTRFLDFWDSPETFGDAAGRPRICVLCQGKMVLKSGPNGQYWACENYPASCSFTLSAEDNFKEQEQTCPKCNRPMIVRKGPYGRFWACSGYPSCRFSMPLSIGMKCPRDNCSGQVIERISKKGKVFYGCSAYPQCDFSVWKRPVNITCPKCDNSYLLRITLPDMRDGFLCDKCHIKFDENLQALKYKHHF